MAIYRETPKCPYCNKVTAKAIYREQASWEPPFIGDSFIRWDYIPHKCKEQEKLINYEK